jgi:hypothetical protein
MKTNLSYHLTNKGEHSKQQRDYFRETIYTLTLVLVWYIGIPKIPFLMFSTNDLLDINIT